MGCSGRKRERGRNGRNNLFIGIPTNIAAGTAPQAWILVASDTRQVRRARIEARRTILFFRYWMPATSETSLVRSPIVTFQLSPTLCAVHGMQTVPGMPGGGVS